MHELQFQQSALRMRNLRE